MYALVSIQNKNLLPRPASHVILSVRRIEGVVCVTLSVRRIEGVVCVTHSFSAQDREVCVRNTLSVRRIEGFVCVKHPFSAQDRGCCVRNTPRGPHPMTRNYSFSLIKFSLSPVLTCNKIQFVK